MELKYKNWNEISVNTFNELKNIDYNKEDGVLGELETNIELLSILCDVDENAISNLSTTEFQYLISQIEFLKTMPKVKVQDKYVINGKKYKVFLTLKDMTISQYIDFQTYYKDFNDKFAECLSCFLIPEGKKYGEGYDIVEVIDDIGNHLSIVDANSIMFFFVLLYRSLTKVTLCCSIKDLKKIMRKTKDREEKNKLKIAIREAEKAMTLLQNGDGFI